MVQELSPPDENQIPGGIVQTLTPVAWLDYLIAQALTLRASDIHIEPTQLNTIVRFRIDGVLRVIDTRPREIHALVTSRLKVLAQLNIAERRKPQEGHAVITDSAIFRGQIDLRLSFFPTVFGEAAVVRILNRSDLVVDEMENLGMEPIDLVRFLEVITRPYGMILVTGPAGAGKTTTLYSALNRLHSEERNIMTLEDPVEYQLEWVRQSQINPDIGFTFANGLRSMLRQDPDVVMIGEIRDQETAEIAIRAALSGRMLFSTLHTNDSIAAIVRFLDFGIPRSFIGSALLAIVAQRLLRKVCEGCAASDAPSQKLLSEAGSAVPVALEKFRKGKGCTLCHLSGYRGRVGIYEILYIDKDIEQLIVEGAPTKDIREAARKKGMPTLREEAIKKAVAGITTLEEAIHTTSV